MTRQIILRQPPSSLSIDRRQPLLSSQSKETTSSSSRGGAGFRKGRFAEVAGGTAAECAAVCCCCPCGIVNLLVLAVYKLPAGLCRKALRRKRRSRMIKKGLLPQRGIMCGCDETELIHIHPISAAVSAVVDVGGMDSDEDVIALEKEMWDRFYGAGFWRSPSQRSDNM